MKPSLTDALCTECGLCCDGSLFADVELTGLTEAAGLEIMGLEIEDDDAGGALLVQPCGALQGKRCGIYAHRPECCRTFECRLLRQVRCGEVSITRARESIAEAFLQIERIHSLTFELGQCDERLPLKERCLEAMAQSEKTAANPKLNRCRTELETALTGVEELFRRSFLEGEGKR